MIHKRGSFSALVASVLFLTAGAYAAAALYGALDTKEQTAEAVRGEYALTASLTGTVVRREHAVAESESFCRRGGAYLLPSCDGFEYLSPDDLLDFSPETPERLMNSIPRESAGGRAVTDYAWYYAALCDTEPEGEECILLFPGASGVNARILRREMTPDGQWAVLFRLTADTEELLSLRFTSAQAVFSACSGLTVPASAVVREGEDEYVYVVAAGRAEKAAVEIIYTDGKQCLSAFPTEADALHEGDRVLTDAAGIYEGKIIDEH